MIIIQPLSFNTLSKASALADNIFPEAHVAPSVGFTMSLDKEKLKEFNASNNHEFVTIEYFVAVEDDTHNVTGTTGLYSLKSDETEAYWVGWYCVDPACRGRGIGSLLLDYIISEAKRRGKKFLRLYTSTHPNEAIAQIIYEQKGFRIVPERGREKMNDYEIFYRERVL
jgi:ribosomal protein S18 acetylase RimI-like enzyme